MWQWVTEHALTKNYNIYEKYNTLGQNNRQDVYGSVFILGLVTIIIAFWAY